MLPPHPPHYPAAPVRTSGLAIASLVLGILALTTCVVPLGLPAVVFGHVALSGMKRSRGSLGGTGLAVAGLVTGYLACIATLAVVAFLVFGFRENAKERKQADELFEVPAFPPSDLPEAGPGEPVEDSQVLMQDLQLDGEGPGGRTRLRLLVPPGEHAPGSLPCVLVGPAGSDLLSGMDLDDGDYFAETLPYAEAGIVVVAYSIDGADEGGDEREAYEDFRRSSAGVANGAAALAFAETRLPFVDKERIFAAGHSSAGTLALLLAAHLPRLAGAVAYAPACDLEDFHKELLDLPFSGVAFPELRHFAKRSSPMTHAGKTRVPLLLFAAEDDELVGPETLRDYARRVEEAGGEALVETVEEGGHYEAMVDDGIAAGIEWMRSRG